jgi:DNA-binding transcriptional LysR family regulator
VLEWARQILADVGGLDAELDAMRGGLTGQLRIGAIPTSLPSVSLLTTPLSRSHPGITVAVYSLNSRQIERGLAEFELELGVTYLDSEPLTGVRTLALYQEHYILLTDEDGPFGGRDEVTWAEAATLPLCLLTGDMQNRRIVDGIFHEAGAEPKPTLETNSISTLITHVRDGPWSSVMAHAWLHAFEVPRGMRVIPLVEPATTRTIGLVWLDRDPEPILARALLNVAAGVDLERALRR